MVRSLGRHMTAPNAVLADIRRSDEAGSRSRAPTQQSVRDAADASRAWPPSYARADARSMSDFRTRVGLGSLPREPPRRAGEARASVQVTRRAPVRDW